jgi:hypothetical protein
VGGLAKDVHCGALWPILILALVIRFGNEQGDAQVMRRRMIVHNVSNNGCIMWQSPPEGYALE